MIAAYSFEEVVLSLGLIDKKTGNLIASERHASLEDVESDTETILSFD